MPIEHSDIQPSAVTGLCPQTSQVLYSTVSQELDASIQPAANADAAHQVATAARQLPYATVKPLVTADQQSPQQHVTASANCQTDSGSPSAQPDVTDAAVQPSEHMHAASLQAGSQEGVVMLLCILSLMPRLPPSPPN